MLLVVLACAVARPFGWPEAVVAVPAAVLVVTTGAIPLSHAVNEAARLAPVVGFLAAVLVLARLCDDEGLFHAAGVLIARTSVGRPRRLLALVFGIASVTTAVLSLDATVVLLTPVVFVTTARLGIRPKPAIYACGHLANTASLLLPVSNLTNLLAFTAAGVSFLHFTALMAAPWLVAIATEYVLFRWLFAADLAAAPVSPAPQEAAPPRREVPVFVLVVLALTLAGFAVTSLVGLNPVWAACAGVVVLAARALHDRRTSVFTLGRAANVPFLAFVLALGVVVRAVVDNGLAGAVGQLIPANSTLPALLGLAAVAAVLANLVNNLPAVLVLLHVAAAGGTGAVLAVLIGVNIGPNLTYVGSLATLLWRRVVQEHEPITDLAEFTRLGLVTVPATLAMAVLALWAGLHLIGA